MGSVAGDDRSLLSRIDVAAEVCACCGANVCVVTGTPTLMYCFGCRGRSSLS